MLRFAFILAVLSCISAYGQSGNAVNDSIEGQKLDEVTVAVRRQGTRRMSGAINGTVINREELFKAACCNLGESFTTNPSVDVNYSDAATGAKQIKLLGLSGIYVQMLTENLPNFRGSASPFALDYVPGPWMNSIQVSKGSSSVKNGYESITGQIDIEYLKPDTDQGVTFNLFGNTLGRMEVNADANRHIGQRLSTVLLAHYQYDFSHHDMNHDGFIDQPNIRQLNLQNRWKWRGEKYLFHGGLAYVDEKRDGGQNHHTPPDQHDLFTIGINTRRFEAYMKHAFIIDPERGSNIALMSNFASQNLDAVYGLKSYSVDERNVYGQLMYESNFNERHNLSAGVSLFHDYLKQKLRNGDFIAGNQCETTIGLYAQYTLTLADRLVAMAGLRTDRSNVFGSFVTPRLHIKYTPIKALSFRLSAGKGYRSVHALAENNNLLASGRRLVIDDLKMERAWNYGASSSLIFQIRNRLLKINVEYYHTRFGNQAVVDYDSDPAIIHISNLNGKSYSNTFQIDASYPIFDGFELTAAYRLNDVKSTFGGLLLEKPLTSRYKGLLSASYKTPLELWQFDATLQLNGGGRMPATYNRPDGTLSWQPRYKAFAQLSAQVTRWFRHFSVYVGGENLTGFRQKRTIINADNPWSQQFDPTMVWGPVHGAVAYVGCRINIGRL